MNPSEPHDARLRRRANDLYWLSDDGVNEIADQLDLSKGALYGLIEPRGADLACPECGAEMEFTNRTARDRGRVHCSACGFEDEAEVVRAITGRNRRDWTVPSTRGSSSSRVALGGALVGVAAVLLLLRWSRR